MTRPIHWLPDDGSAQILAAYARTREPLRSVLRRALRLLDPRGHIRRPGPERKQP